MTSQAMGCISTFDHSTELGVTHPCLLASGTHGACGERRTINHTFCYVKKFKANVRTFPLLSKSVSECFVPGPMPTLMMSAPARISSSTISPVTTFPAFKKNNVFVIHYKVNQRPLPLSALYAIKHLLTIIV